MATGLYQFASAPMPGDIVCANYGVSALAAGLVVVVDGTNVIDPTTMRDAPGVKLAGAEGAIVLGVTMESIAASGGFGRVRTMGIAVCTAKGAITAGAAVMGTTLGEAKTCGAGKAQLGIALSTTSADGDQVLVDICRATNA